MEIRAVHDLEAPKASFLNETRNPLDDDNDSDVDLTAFEVEKERVITHEELQYLVEKLHRFAKLQIAKLNHETGVVHDNLNRQLQRFMRRSMKVLIMHHGAGSAESIQEFRNASDAAAAGQNQSNRGSNRNIAN